MPTTTLAPDVVLTLLAQTPPRIATLTADLSPAQLRTPPTPGEWSANAVLAHLRACADVWGDCMRTIIAEDAPTIRAINPRTWITRTAYLDLEFAPSLRAFTRQRTELLAFLEPLARGQWLRTATITGAGRPPQKTALDYATRMATHERAHLKQMARTAASLRGKR